MSRAEFKIAGDWHHLGELTIDELSLLSIDTGIPWPGLVAGGSINAKVETTWMALGALARKLGISQESIDESRAKMPASVLDQITRLVMDENIDDTLPYGWEDGLPLGTAPATRPETT